MRMSEKGNIQPWWWAKTIPRAFEFTAQDSVMRKTAEREELWGCSGEISFRDSSGSLSSVWSPGETLGNWNFITAGFLR